MIHVKNIGLLLQRTQGEECPIGIQHSRLMNMSRIGLVDVSCGKKENVAEIDNRFQPI